MTKLTIIKYLIFLLLLTGCNLKSIDYKTGISRTSKSIEASKENGVFRFQLYPENSKIQLAENDMVQILNAWVEYGWSYKNENNEIVVKKREYSKVVIQVDSLDSNYTILMNDENFSWSGVFSAILKNDNDSLEITFFDNLERVKSKPILTKKNENCYNTRLFKIKE